MRGVCPLGNLGADKIGDKERIRGTITWVSLLVLGLFYQQLNIPGDGSDKAGGWQDGFWISTCLFSGELAWQGIRLNVAGTWAKNRAHVACRELSSLADWM